MSTAPEAVSWYQADSEPCLSTVRRLTTPDDHVAVVGAGASGLVVDLVKAGYEDVEAVDIAAAALGRLRAALGDATAVTLRQADVREVEFDRPLDLWHDRATFHFLTDPADQARYVRQAAGAVRPGGHLVMATFGPDGPEMCSGLPVQRYGPSELAAAFASQFRLVDSFERVHHTPMQTTQAFLHAVLRRP